MLPSAKHATTIRTRAGAKERLASSALALCTTACSLMCSSLPAYALFFGYDQQAEALKHQGDYAYESQNFPSAVNYYGQAINALPSDAYQSLAGLYYSRALANDVSGDYSAATDDWQHSKDCDDQLIQAAAENPQANIDTAWAKSTSGELGGLITWRKTCDPSSADYFGDMGMVLWPAAKFPLRVYVDESSGRGFGAGSRDAILQAMSCWAAANPSRIRFTEVDDISQADVIFQRPLPGQVAQGSGGRTTSDDNTDARGVRTQKRAYVKLTCATQDYTQMTDYYKHQLYNLALHESGHVLGMGGHSPSGLDVMYWKSPLMQLSERDIATIRRMYP